MLLDKIKQLLKKMGNRSYYKACYKDSKRYEYFINSNNKCIGNLINSGYFHPDCDDCPYRSKE